MYRGYRYDIETGLYYLQSRYYNPDWGRFINADGNVGNQGELLSANMFTYCGNNPINRTDSNGQFWEEIGNFFNQVVNSMRSVFAPVYAVAGGCAVADGPLPIGDIVGAVIAVGATIGAVVYASTHTHVTSKADTKTIEIAPTIPKSRVIFPENPDDFHPAGLTPLRLPGTKNGPIIKWMAGKSEVFEWDANTNGPAGNGPHYHIRELGGIHYEPGEVVPEPYATIYFGG